jgi:phage terminase large subunit-like protein
MYTNTDFLILREIRQRLKDPNSEFYKYNWDVHGRLKQKPPPGNWRFWFTIGGRGVGKTRTGTEWVRSLVENAKEPLHIGLIGQTVADVSKVMIRGIKSGLLDISPIWFKPTYVPSKREIIWPNGCKATTYSGDTPDQLRGPQHHYIWMDEPAKFMYLEDVFDNANMGLRLGKTPKMLITGTPKPIEMLRKYKKKANIKRDFYYESKDGDVVMVFSSTYENESNLPEAFIRDMKDKYEGTRHGRQEIGGEILEDIEGALWNSQMIERNRIKTEDCPELAYVAVGVDPYGGAADGECGIVVVGKDKLRGSKDEPEIYYITHDFSGQYTPRGWGKKTVYAYNVVDANAVFVETNYGGDMAIDNIHNIDRNILVKKVVASRGKNIRAEPLAGLTEQNRLKFVGSFPILEDQMCTFQPHEPKQKSPDRLDAMVIAGQACMNRKGGGMKIY